VDVANTGGPARRQLICPYLDQLARQLPSWPLLPGTVARNHHLWHCRGFAAHRDLWDDTAGRFVCGFNPAGPADDTLLIGRITDDAGQARAILVNYACHPTTLAWDNRALSPDWVGAMRETVEAAAGGICLFLQGASGDLGPREGFVGDTEVADRNGRQVGHAALAALEALAPAGTRFVYAGPVWEPDRPLATSLSIKTRSSGKRRGAGSSTPSNSSIGPICPRWKKRSASALVLRPSKARRRRPATPLAPATAGPRSSR
jgi:hypothetical protein